MSNKKADSPPASQGRLELVYSRTHEPSDVCPAGDQPKKILSLDGFSQQRIASRLSRPLLGILLVIFPDRDYKHFLQARLFAHAAGQSVAIHLAAANVERDHLRLK